MAKLAVFDEFHITIHARVDLPPIVFARARRTLDSLRFQARLRKAVAGAIRQHTSLKVLKFTVSR